MLTQIRINELARRHKSNNVFIIQKFLNSLNEKMTYNQVKLNLKLDAKMYRWNAVTIRTIAQGIKEFFKLKNFSNEI
jgi:hypothetical protein